MWIPFVNNSCNYLIKVSKDTSTLMVNLTDLKCIWETQLSYENVVEKYKECNPLCDISALKFGDVVDQVLQLANSISTNYAVINSMKCEEDNANDLLLELKSKNEEFTTCFTFTLFKLGTEMFFQEVTLPLIQTVQYLETKHSLLCDLLEKKDKEIAEHRLEGGEITTRTSLITEKFDKTSMETTVTPKLFLDVFGKCKEFCGNLVSNFGADKKLFKPKKVKLPVLPKKRPKLTHKYNIAATGIPYKDTSA